MRDFKKIDFFIETLEKACLLLTKTLGLDFFDSLLRAGNDLLHETNEQGLDEKNLAKLKQYYRKLHKETFLNEEIRLAMELLIIKGFKHRFRYSLSLMTPDSICYLFAYIISRLASPNQTIIDMALGTGNLISAIANYLPFATNLIGIEKDPNLAHLAKLNIDLQGGIIDIHLNDCLDEFYLQGDFVIGDLDTKKEKEYFPYKVINRALEFLNSNGHFIFLIDNDFFNQDKSQEFKENFKGTMLGIIVLPDSLFQNNIVGKSILIGSRKQFNKFDMMALSLPEITEKEKLNEAIEQLDQWLKQVKGKVI